MKKNGKVILILGVIALIALEYFAYSVTEYALFDLWGTASILSIPLAEIVATAIAVIDLAVFTSLFIGKFRGNVSSNTWYIFGGWFLFSTACILLVWWGVGVSLIAHGTLLRWPAVAVAGIVFFGRIMILNMISLVVDRISTRYHYKGHLPNTEYFTVYRREINDRR